MTSASKQQLHRTVEVYAPMLTRALAILFLFTYTAQGEPYPAWYANPLIVQTPAMQEIEPGEPHVFAEAQDSGWERSLRVYRPIGLGAPAPVVVLVTAGMHDTHEAGAYDGWARLLASRGVAAVLYDTPLVGQPRDLNDTMRRASDDLDRVLAAIDEHAAQWELDTRRLAFWMCSANTRRGLKDAYFHADRLSAVAVLYGVFEIEPNAIAPALPVMVVRAGQDSAAINETIDQFASEALAQNADFTLVNLPDAEHAFDIGQGSPAAYAAIEQTVTFLTRRLTAPEDAPASQKQDRPASGRGTRGDR